MTGSSSGTPQFATAEYSAPSTEGTCKFCAQKISGDRMLPVVATCGDFTPAGPGFFSSAPGN